MSDSSSSDEEESRFREACDPSLWRTATQGASKDGTWGVEVSDSQRHCHGQSDQRQSFVLLEKIRTSLANGQGKTAYVWVRHRDHPTTQCKQAGRVAASTAMGAASAPSTLSPFLAKQLTSRLNGSVEYQHSQEEDGGGGDGQHPKHPQQPLRLLNNLPLAPQASIAPTHTPAMKRRAARALKRHAYFDGCDGVRVKEQCRSVAVSPDWILSGEAAYPHPHPKNVRYLQKYKLEERQADGSIIAVPCSAPDDTITATTTTTTTTRTGKTEKGKGVACISQTGKEDSSLLHREEALNCLQDGGISEGLSTEKKKTVACISQTGKKDSAKTKHEETLHCLMNGSSTGPNSNTRKERKQTRKRGRKKRLKGGDETTVP